MTLGDKIRQAMTQLDEAGLKKTYLGGDVKTMLNKLATAADNETRGPVEDTCRAPITVKSVRRGDVFIASTYGGKVRPWVVLRVRGEMVDALAFSSGDKAPELEQSRCRYWPGAWLGSATAVFSLAHATKEVTRPYTDLPHLAEIENRILARAQPPRTENIGQILAKLRKQAQRPSAGN